MIMEVSMIYRYRFRRNQVHQKPNRIRRCSPSPDGEVTQVETGISDTLADFKRNISDSLGINFSDIVKFVFAGTRLKFNQVAVIDQIRAIIAMKPHDVRIDENLTANVMVEMMVCSRGEGSRQVTVASAPHSSGGGRLQIHVKTYDDREIPVEIAPTDTMEDLKEKLFNETDIDPDHQRFICCGTQLNHWYDHGIVFDMVNAVLPKRPDESPNSPSDERIVHATIHMVLRLRGGGNAVHHHDEVQFHSDSDGENPRDIEGGNAVSNEVQVPSRLPTSNGNKHLQDGKGTEESSAARCCCFSSFCCK